MSERYEMPEDPTLRPEQSLDALEEKVLGATEDQERGDESGRGPDDGDDATSTPVADEPPA